ncbi:MAG: redoxin domain-containing protein [Bosea sp. (in: a-proteobacteria)]
MAQAHTVNPAAEVRAPELAVTRWFNTPKPITLACLAGKVVLLHAFQMLCPGCVAHGTPQAERAHRMFSNTDLTVIGLHTVFEHHAAMMPVSLEAFIHEYRLTFPIGVDAPGKGTPIPVTMQRYQMQGTPTSILIGRDGNMRHQGFGQEDDMALGMIIGSLLAETLPALETAVTAEVEGCDSGACPIPKGA